MEYELVLRNTSAGVGFFSTRPVEQMGLPEAARYLVAHPNDQFIRKFLLEGVECLEPEELGRIIAENLHAPRPFVAMLYEACILEHKFRGLTGRFQGIEPQDLAPHSPLVYIRSELLPDHFTHREWVDALATNRDDHAAVPSPEDVGEDFPIDQQQLDAVRSRNWTTVDKVLAQADARAVAVAPRPPMEQSYATAVERLTAIEAFAEPELRHEQSLSPAALMRRWWLDRTVANGRNDYRLKGLQTSWGKGLAMEAAKVSYAMEIVERVSSFASVDAGGLVGYARPHPLVQGSYADVSAMGAALDPNRVRLDVPYQGEPLWWLQGEDANGHAVFIPAQLVFLFCNLDEATFFSGLSSTGLASGNTLTEARFAALLECIERDAEAVAIYRPEDCFILEADDPQVSELLGRYREAGVQPVFQDLRSDLGVAAYKAFVVGEDGVVAKGTAAHLDGRKAALSALLEVTYPFPKGPASRPAPEGLPVRRWEDLPNHASGEFGRDLARLETVLQLNGHGPLYLDLTRADVGLPVVKALGPGLELTADLDRFSRVSPRLFARYLEAIGTY